MRRPMEPPRKPEEWTKCVHRLIKRMNHELGLLYDGVEEVSDGDTATTEADPGEDIGISEDTPISALAQMFNEQCQNLDVFLSTPTKGPVKFPIRAVINMLTRCLRVTSEDLKSRPSLSELAALLPGLHQHALVVLTQMVTCCGSNVLPQSHPLVDLILQVLTGSSHMKPEDKSLTRACAFQVLCLLLGQFGWGKYLQSQSRALIGELISDIVLQEAPKKDFASSPAPHKVEVELITQRKGKKKKKGKKNKGDSYSDLSLPSTGCASEAIAFNSHATQGALELSRLVVERAEYSQVQTLVQCLLDTTKTLQREGPPALSPYESGECRLDLYGAIFACASVRLGPDSSRKDTIKHFQATNLALSLLTTASHSDSSKDVQRSCKSSIALLRRIGNMTRPIVRRILPDEHNDARDIMEVEKESERLTDENKRLRKQLVDAQLEMENQRRELVALQVAKNQFESEKPKDAKDLGSKAIEAHTNGENTNSDREEEEDVPLEENVDKQEEEMERESSSELLKPKHYEKFSKEETRKTEVSVEKATDLSPGKEEVLSTAQEIKKRLLDNTEDDTRQVKKSRIVSSHSTETGDDLAAMISDFVDAAPDS